MPLVTRPAYLHHISDVVGRADRRTDVLLPTTEARYMPCWVRAIGEPRPWTRRFVNRCLGAWAVLAGKAVALQWPKDGELELALYGPIREPLREAGRSIEEHPKGDAA